MSEMNSGVDEYLEKANQWKAASEELRRIALDCGLTEELKWGKPCYTFEGNNVVIIQGFKEVCALMFFKGALLDKSDGVLKKPGPNTRAARRIEFACVGDVVEMEPTIKAYIEEAIEAERAGKEVKLEQNPEPIPEEFQQRLDEDPQLETAFKGLTPGRQRAYILYFSGAKQSKTRSARVDRHVERILDGKGMRD